MEKELVVFEGKSKSFSKMEREELLSALVTSAFMAKWENFRQEGVELACTLYDRYIGPHLETIKKLPPKWTTTDKVVSFISPSMDWKMHIDVGSAKLFIEKHSVITVDVRDEVSDKACAAFVRKQEHIRSEREDTRRQTRAALESIRSTKQLFEIWPEAYKVYLELFPTDDTPMLPSIPVATLNERLGL